MPDERPLEPPPPAAPPRKRRWLSGCLGCGGLALLLLIGLGVLGALGEGDAGGAAAATRSYSSSLKGLNAELAKDYAPFTFNYPASWQIMENGSEPDDQYYVRLLRSRDGKLAEAFLVGSMLNRPEAVQDPAMLRPLVDEMGKQLPAFQLVKMGPHTVGGRPGLQFTFNTVTEDDREMWGRAILLPGDDGRGLWLVLTATALSDSVQGPAHVGERGDLGVVLRSFRMGQK